MAFQELKKYASVKLGIPNGIGAAKAGGGALKVVKAKHPDMDSVNACKEAMKELDNNLEKYRKLI